MTNSLKFFIPDIILLAGLVLTVVTGFMYADKAPKWHLKILNMVLILMLFGFLPFAGEFAKFSGLDEILSNAISLVPVENYSFKFLNDAVSVSPLSIFFKFLITLSALLASLLGVSFIKKLNQKTPKFASLYLFALLGAYAVTISNDFISLFISLEILTMAVYFLIACFSTREDKSARVLEGAVKYFIGGEIASCFMLFGISYIYLSLGSVNFTEIHTLLAIPAGAPENISPVLNIGEVIFFTALIFKISAFPFYIWIMDVFKGANYTVNLFISTVVEITGVYALIKALSSLASFGSVLSFALILSASITLVIGNLLALRVVKKEGSFKEFLAASTVSNLGYVLLGVSFISKGTLEASIYFLIVYVVSTFGLFSAFMLLARNLRKAGGINTENLDTLNGLAYISPFFGTAFSIVLLSFAAFPPMAGFGAKFYLFAEILRTGIWAVYPLLIAALASIFALYYYLKIASSIHQKPNVPRFNRIYKKEPVFSGLNIFTAVLSLCAAGLILLFFFSAPVIEMLKNII